MGKEVEIRAKENDSYRPISSKNQNEDDEELLKKRFNLLALSPKLNNEQSEVIETLFGYYWYKNCETNIIK